MKAVEHVFVQDFIRRQKRLYYINVKYIKYIYTKFIKENSINVDYHFGEASVSNDMVSIL